MRSAHRQRGAAALTVTLVLFFVMTMAAAYANRHHAFELRASANQYRAMQAFEAAEAGAEWAIAMLNSPRPVNATCQPAGDGDKTFRERHLDVVRTTGAVTPVTWNRNGVALPARAACVRSTDTGWNCNCPADGEPAPSAPTAAGPAPAFIVQFAPVAQPGLVQLIATGCSRLAGPCAPGTETVADGSSRIQLTVGLVPALATPPVAPLTVKGAVRAGTAALGLHNPDAASGGFVVHAGGMVQAANARLATAPGGPAAATLVEQDAMLGALDGDRLFASFFGMGKALWSQQPGVARLRCDGSCDAAVRQATAASRGHRMLWIDGDLSLEEPMTIGSAQRPVVMVARGAVRLRGAITLHGVVYGASLAWDDTAGGAMLRGAAISEGDYQGNGAPDLVYDSAVLDALKHATGSFARVPGSWSDFR